jgi:hypothetical protein
VPEYSHLLIPTRHQFCPPPGPVMDFLNGVVALGVVGANPAVNFVSCKRVASQVRHGRNPFTGEVLTIRTPSRSASIHRSLSSIKDIAGVAEGTPEFNVDVSGRTRPRVPPLEIAFAKAYHLAVRCCVRSRLVSTSDLHEESKRRRGTVAFGEDCSANDSLGLYTHPETLELIEVPGAGCARFWIEFELGKNLFPKIEDGNLAILNPQLLALASKCFNAKFVQGCLWSA